MRGARGLLSSQRKHKALHFLQRHGLGDTQALLRKAPAMIDRKAHDDLTWDGRRGLMTPAQVIDYRDRETKDLPGRKEEKTPRSACEVYNFQIDGTVLLTALRSNSRGHDTAPSAAPLPLD